MDKVKETLNKVPLSGYIVLVIAIAIFSGLFANAGHGLNIFDFDTLNGKFGTMSNILRSRRQRCTRRLPVCFRFGSRRYAGNGPH